MRINKINNNNTTEEVTTNSSKKGVVSFQIDLKLWAEFDHRIESEYGRYKKSKIIENLIRNFMIHHKKIDI